MKKALARKILAKNANLSRPFNALSELTMRIEDEDQRRQVRKALGMAMGYMAEVVMIVVREHPDLDPDKIS